MRKASFVRHSPCPKCGSRDNLALYSDGGGYCFGCGYTVRAGIQHQLGLRKTDSLDGDLNGDKLQRQSARLVPGTILLRGVDWLQDYGVSVQEALSRGVCSDTLGRTCFYFRNTDKATTSRDGIESEELFLIQARSHDTDKTKAYPKYITYGKPEDSIPIYYVGSPEWRSDCLVLVEDCISAIKVARLTDAMPILGSDLSLRKLTRLKALYGRFRVWLDSNMYHKACRIANRLEWMGCEAQAVYSDLDPKCYNNDEIKSFLKLDNLC